MKRDYTCELQMNNRRQFFFYQSLFPMLLFLNGLFVILPILSISYLHLCLPLHLSFSFFLLVQNGCIDAGSHMLLAESQLSLVLQSDGPGHTSGNPWQRSPLPSLLHHPHRLYGADWIEIFRRLLRLLKQQNRYRTKTLRRSVFHLGAEQRLHMLLLKSFSALCCNTAFIN